MKKLFGTDGIRGTANQYPMTTNVVHRVGQALGYILRRECSHIPKVLIGKDTRLSGYMVEMALSSGLNSMGVHVQLVGPLPTPGIGFLAQNMRVDAGVVISASHNKYQDNGIKIFGADGFKISKSMEDEIERLVLSGELDKLLAPSTEVGRSKRIDDASGRYVVYAKSTFPQNYTLEGMRIVVDCANGAAYKVAPTIFEELGAEVIVIGNRPNGTNINDECGALYPDRLGDAVLKYRADLGIALDGDADRIILVDEKAKVVNGDHILAICGIHMKEKGELKNNTIVCTKMSNYGLNKLMEKHGINVVATSVGDKYIVEEMRKSSYNLGGEQSGHIIFLDHSTTGDGIVAALRVISVMLERNQKLSELNDILEDMPQILKNLKVSKRVPLEDIKAFQDALKQIEKEMNGNGRVFVRFSGTEPLVRVLVEGPDHKKITTYANHLGELLTKELS